MAQSMIEKRSVTARRLGGLDAIRKLPLADRLAASATVVAEAGKRGLARKFAARAIEEKRREIFTSSNWRSAVLLAIEYGFAGLHITSREAAMRYIERAVVNEDYADAQAMARDFGLMPFLRKTILKDLRAKEVLERDFRMMNIWPGVDRYGVCKSSTC